ncbi:MAG: hypothetical protein JXA09_10265 [Anaerolineae bacterium]|nr:hypothetical protein [Anaerolineae bacterium]
MSSPPSPQHRISRPALCLLVFCVLGAIACGPLSLGPRDTPAPVASPTPVQAATPTTAPVATATPTGAAGAPAPPAGPEGTDLIDCPPAGSTMLLKFSADITIEHEGAVIQHVLHDGVLGLVVSRDGRAIESAEGAPIVYEMNGSMPKCVLEGEGTMTPSASGYCENGVVYLTIVEEWGAYNGTMTCEDTVIPLNIPSMGTMTHTGADGQGEVFYLDRSFSSEGAGYTSIRPFSGPGSGQHVWTLFYEWTGPVAPQG